MKKTVETKTAATPKGAAKHQDDQLPEYEPVIVRLSAVKDASAISTAGPPDEKPKRPRRKLELEEALLSRKWISILSLTGVVMLIAGSMTGIGVYMLIKSRAMEHSEHLNKGQTISAQCVDYLKTNNVNEQYCVFEKLDLAEGDTCSSSCNVLEWWIKVDEKNENVVSFYEAPHGQQNFTKLMEGFIVRHGTKCNYDNNITCSGDGKCSAKQQEETPKPVTLKLFKKAGRWMNTCSDGLAQCLRFPDITAPDGTKFSKAASEAAWQNMLQNAGCADLQRAQQHCEEYAGVVQLVPRFQFRRCVVNDSYSARNLKCVGQPVVIYNCMQCPIGANSANITAYKQKECNPSTGTVSNDCLVSCDDGRVVVMPDGYACRRGADMYCLMGHCYHVSNGTFSDCTNI